MRKKACLLHVLELYSFFFKKTKPQPNDVCMQQSERETVAGAGAWGSVFVAVFIRVKGSVTIWKPFMGKLASSQYCKFALLTF